MYICFGFISHSNGIYFFSSSSLSKWRILVVINVFCLRINAKNMRKLYVMYRHSIHHDYHHFVKLIRFNFLLLYKINKTHSHLTRVEWKHHHIGDHHSIVIVANIRKQTTMKMQQNSNANFTPMNSSWIQSIIYWRVWTWTETDILIIPSTKRTAKTTAATATLTPTAELTVTLPILHVPCNSIQLISVLCRYSPFSFFE